MSCIAELRRQPAGRTETRNYGYMVEEMQMALATTSVDLQMLGKQSVYFPHP
jgi:hypothetical protein